MFGRALFITAECKIGEGRGRKCRAKPMKGDKLVKIKDVQLRPSAKEGVAVYAASSVYLTTK